MTDETNPPVDGEAGAEPEPGSTEWLLAQLSGGRIDSRRERREAEAALEAAGVPIPDATAEHDAVEDAAPAQEEAAEASRAEASSAESPQTEVLQTEAPQIGEPEAPAAAFRPVPAVPDERPRGRFSWDTGRVEAVDPAPARDEATTAAGSDEPAQPNVLDGFETLPATAGTSEGAPAIPFMWNLAPTHEPDPALNPPVVIPEPSFDEPDFPFPSAAPIVVPKPAARSAAADAASEAPEPAQTEQAAAASAPIASSEPSEHAPLDASGEPAPSAAPADDAAPAAEEPAQPDAPAVPAAPAPAPLPPGTTTHEFDPFAQDLFAPVPPTTPVPSVDEFTIPDEGSSAPASAIAHDEPHDDTDTDTQHVSSDWSDIADMLGAHPETVDTAIVSPMPPVNEILPSFDAILPRSSAGKTPEPPAAETAAPGHDLAPAAAPFAQAPVRAQTPPPAHPGGVPVEHARGGSPLNRWLVIAAAILLAILIGIGLFALGRAVAAGRDQAPAATTHTATPKPTQTTASPSPSPTQTASENPAIAGSGPLAPGQSYQWDQLRGGECLDPFTSPWDQTFTVVDCNAPHAAQLVYTAPFSADPSAAFPGEQQISSQIGALCGKPGVVDLNAASAYSDVQISAAYPVNAQQWAAGQRNYFCFVTRSSGQQLSSSIAGPGPTQ